MGWETLYCAKNNNDLTSALMQIAPGMLIKKGTVIELPITASHYQPEFFPNPTKFEPERFLKENADQIIPYTYRPFGGNQTAKYTYNFIEIAR